MAATTTQEVEMNHCERCDEPIPAGSGAIVGNERTILRDPAEGTLLCNECNEDREEAIIAAGS